jgi:hypothetical protein
MTLRSRIAPTLALGLTQLVAAQTGRTMSLGGPALLGTNFAIRVAHPTAAGGNYYEALTSAPTPGAVNLGLPFVQGLARIDVGGFFTLYNGMLSATGITTQSLAVPNSTGLLGATFDVQTIDVDLSGPTLYLADNDVTPRVLTVCRIDIAQSTSTALLTSDNDLQRVTNASVGAPVSQGLARFAYGVTRHRGLQGFVEGYGGPFSSTSHTADIDSQGLRRVARRLVNAYYQVVSCPNGYDISIIRDPVNQRQCSVLSYERATGTPRIIPGTTFVDTSPSAPSSSVQILGFYPAFSLDGTWATCIVQDSSANSPPPDRVIAFRTDGRSAAIDITATTPASAVYFDGAHFCTRDFLIVQGSGGYYWTRADNPTTLQPLALPNTAANNAPNVWAYPFSWRISDDGAIAYVPIGSHPTAWRAEMDLVKIAPSGSVPVATNHTRFATPKGLCEFGYAAITPSPLVDSLAGMKCSVSPSGTRVAVLGTAGGAFSGLYLCDGSADPQLRSVAGANFYAEVVFLNEATVLFFAGATPGVHAFYKLDVPSGTITQIGTATNHQPRGQFWSLNRSWWYFVRSDPLSTVNNLVAVEAATGLLRDITGNEFSSGNLPSLRTGSLNTTVDPWFAQEMQLRRAPSGNRAWFTARRETGATGTYEDANVFMFDIETGGAAVALTNNTGRGTGAGSVLNIEGLTISADGNHLAWAQRYGNSDTTSEDVFHLNLLTSAARQVSVSTPSGQSVTDGSIRFTCNPPNGLAWSMGTGSVTVPSANVRVDWAPLSGGAPFSVTPAPMLPQILQVIGS